MGGPPSLWRVEAGENSGGENSFRRGVVSDFSDIGTTSHVIQLAVAPAFLLTAIGAMMSVMAGRLARVIDRARLLEGRLEHAADDGLVTLHRDLGTLCHRANLINLAITLCTAAAVVVCTVIAILFLGNLFLFNMSIPIALLFILAMFFLVLGLVIFLREIFIATASLRIGPHDTGSFVRGSSKR